MKKIESSNTKLAVYDHCKTLSIKYLGEMCREILHKKGLYAQASYDDFQECIRKYADPDDNFGYQDVVNRYEKIEAQALAGQRVEDIQEVLKEVNTVAMKCIRPGMQAHMDAMRERGYDLIICSAAAGVALRAMDYIAQFDDVLAFELGTTDGKYDRTITQSMSAHDAKMHALHAFKTLNPQYNHVVSFGDSAHDYPMLDVSNAFVGVAPNVDLRRIIEIDYMDRKPRLIIEESFAELNLDELEPRK